MAWFLECYWVYLWHHQGFASSQFSLAAGSFITQPYLKPLQQERYFNLTSEVCILQSNLLFWLLHVSETRTNFKWNKKKYGFAYKISLKWDCYKFKQYFFSLWTLHLSLKITLTLWDFGCHLDFLQTRAFISAIILLKLHISNLFSTFMSWHIKTKKKKKTYIM